MIKKILIILIILLCVYLVTIFFLQITGSAIDWIRLKLGLPIFRGEKPPEETPKETIETICDDIGNCYDIYYVK